MRALFLAASDEVIAERNDIEVPDLKISPGKSLALILSLMRLHSCCVLTCSARHLVIVMPFIVLFYSFIWIVYLINKLYSS